MFVIKNILNSELLVRGIFKLFELLNLFWKNYVSSKAHKIRWIQNMITSFIVFFVRWSKNFEIFKLYEYNKKKRFVFLFVSNKVIN